MKAFKVTYRGAGYSGAKMFVVAEDKDGVEEALMNKSSDKYDPDSKWCEIDEMMEVPLSKVKLSDLSIVEFMRLSEVKNEEL